MESNYNVGAYVRLSKKDDENDISNSIINQKYMVKSYLDNDNSLKLIDYYIDDGYSGLNFERPEFKVRNLDIAKYSIDSNFKIDDTILAKEYIARRSFKDNINIANIVKATPKNSNWHKEEAREEGWK